MHASTSPLQPRSDDLPAEAQPAPGPDIFMLIAAAILAAGRGPEAIPSIVAGFRQELEFASRIAAAVAALQVVKGCGQ